MTGACRGVRVFTIAFRMMSSLRMAAVSAAFLGFPSGEQPLVKGLDDRVTPRRGERGHLQDCADLCTPTADMACPTASRSRR